jgi:Sigma-70 region 2
MPAKNHLPLLQIIHQVVYPHGDDRVSDRELLRCYVKNRDENAFAALMRRHGAMVLGVGVRVLGRHQDAEDICQATFLLLARKANSVPWRDSVVIWLYSAAYRLALHSRSERRKRAAREQKVSPKQPPDTMAEITLRDFQETLDVEIARLPKKYEFPSAPGPRRLLIWTRKNSRVLGSMWERSVTANW